MREILGDVLGKNFSNISLKNYKKTLKEIEDEEDYQTAKNALKQDKLQKQQNKEEGLLKVNETIDVDTLVQSLPLIYKFGLGMIEGFYEVKNLNLLDDTEKSKNGSQTDASVDLGDNFGDDDSNMREPVPLSRDAALEVMQEEQNRYIRQHYKYY